MSRDKKPKAYEARLDRLPDRKVFINVQHLENGTYELNVVYRNKVLVTTRFKKQ